MSDSVSSSIVRESGTRERCSSGLFDIVVMAASAGGVPALTEVLSTLPADFEVPVAIVLHRTGKEPHLLAKVLGRSTWLRVKIAEAGETMRPGTVYLAPADLHLSVRRNGVWISPTAPGSGTSVLPRTRSSARRRTPSAGMSSR